MCIHSVRYRPDVVVYSFPHHKYNAITIIQFLLFSDKSYTSYPVHTTSYPENIFFKNRVSFCLYDCYIYRSKNKDDNMDSNDKNIQAIISEFLTQYDISDLTQALQHYTDMHQEYICRTKASISKLKISDIYYLEILEHNIAVHTEHGIYQKYGTLNNELKQLSPHGFMKCNQSCIVALDKIRTVHNNEIILTNQEHLYMSRYYAPNILMAFSRNDK